MNDRRSDANLGWGILGTGGIATKFAKDVVQSESGRLVAVASRTQESAERFGDEFDIPNRYAGYDELLSDPIVDAVYVALPNHLHARWVIRCAETGKHILCEKPLATNHGEAMTTIEAVRRHDVFLMEAFMYRFHPQTAKLIELVHEGVIGDLRLIQAAFSFDLGDSRPGDIRRQNGAAGGGIMDVGCYCVSMARLLAGVSQGRNFAEPLDIKGVGHIDSHNRVDHWASAVLRFPGDVVAELSCGIGIRMDNAVRVWGSKGHIVVPMPWHPGDGAVILVNVDGEEEPRIVRISADRPIYAIEADTVARHVTAPQAPPPCMTWADTLGNMRVLDAWRREIDLVFDNERLEALRDRPSGRALSRADDAPMQFGRVLGVNKPISRIVMGSMAFKPGNPSYAAAMLDDYYERGGNCIDTAWVYGTERSIGEWLTLRGVREDMVLIGKGAHTPECYPDALTQQLYQSLDRLQTDYLDIYMLHRDNLDIPVGEFIEVLNAHQRAGRIRAFGGSNWTVERIVAANRYAEEHGLASFSVSSPNLSLAVWNEPPWPGCVSASDADSRAWYAREQLPLFAWSSQATGLVTGRYRPEDRDDPTLGFVARTWFSEVNFQRLARIEALAEERGLTAAQVGLAWVLCQQFPTYALIGPRTIDETRTSIEALRVTLSPADMSWLNLER